MGRSLRNLAIPGSHNAITYCLDRSDRSPVDLTQPDLLQKLDKYMKPLIRPFVYKWAVTQEATVKEQLDCGVRYLDLRIAHRPNDTSTDLYFYHGVYTTLTVETVLQEIRSWLDVHTREVVLLSFSHFLGLNQDLHTGLISTIRTIFTSRLCPTTGHLQHLSNYGRDTSRLCPTTVDNLQALSNNGRDTSSSVQLRTPPALSNYVGHLQALSNYGRTPPALSNYGRRHLQALSNYGGHLQALSNYAWHEPYFPMIPFPDPNIPMILCIRKVTLRNLWTLGYQVYCLYEHSMVSLYSELWPHIPYWWANKVFLLSGGFFVTGINLTEDLKYICSHPTESLKDLVMSTSPALLSWVRAQSPGSDSRSLNIIAGDFVSESHFVPTVIALNQHLVHCTGPCDVSGGN
nr:PI-PLC X domain-containing protein 1-like [Salvelinus alpinus]